MFYPRAYKESSCSMPKQIPGSAVPQKSRRRLRARGSRAYCKLELRRNACAELAARCLPMVTILMFYLVRLPAAHARWKQQALTVHLPQCSERPCVREGRSLRIRQVDERLHEHSHGRQHAHPTVLELRNASPIQRRLGRGRDGRGKETHINMVQILVVCIFGGKAATAPLYFF